MEICLGINDDTQQTLKRYETMKKFVRPPAFSSSFLKEYAGVNLYFKNGEKVKVEVQPNAPNSNPSMQPVNINNNQEQKYIKDLNDLFG